MPSGAGAVSLLIIIGIVALFIVFALLNSITVVDAGTRGVVKTFGEVTDVLPEGLHFRTPFVTSVVIVDIKTQRYQADTTAASRDLQDVTTQVVLNYRPNPDSVGNLIRDIGVEYENVVIDPAIQESVKAATAQFTAEELITQRPLVSNSIRDVLVERLETRGITVQEVSITEFSFQPEFSRAIEQKQVAEQDALRAVRELERARTQAQKQVAEAEAQAEARRALAEAEADARLRVAQAEAEALRLQRQVITPALLQLRFIESWNGVLPRFTAGESGLMPLVQIPEDAFEGTDTSGSIEPIQQGLPATATPTPAPESVQATPTMTPIVPTPTAVPPAPES
jgi:regulator of protease activity HflC (stomatin/prohibitin superfamily)